MALTAFETLFQRCSSNPAVAAAVTVLANSPLPLPPGRLEPALRAVAPHLTTDEWAAWWS